MSGRSAYVRQKKGQLADKSFKKQYSGYGDNDNSPYGFSDHPVSRPAISTNPSYVSTVPQHSRRRLSISSVDTTYAYPPAPLRKSRPIIVASAIERSDFRTHLDGMSASLRGALGKFIKGDEKTSVPDYHRPIIASPSSDSGSRSTGFTPSLSAVPSLSPTTPPAELLGGLPSLGMPSPYAVRTKQHQRSVIHKVRRFEGGGKPPQLEWKSLSNNPELWDENGDTFIYMYMLGSRTKPPPSFRVNSRVIEQSGSQTFISQLRNVKEPDGWPPFYPSSMPFSDVSSSPDDTIESFDSFRHGVSTTTQTTSRSDSIGLSSIRPYGIHGRPSHPTAHGIQYEIYIPWPGAETGVHSTIWHITTRNYFAVMYDASSLVGTTFHEAISNLHERISSHPGYLSRKDDGVAWITDYIVRHRFDDVRNNPSYAASLLAFSESPEVLWKEGYIEAYVHCVGMLNMGLQTVPEWQFITPHTKMFLQNANMEIEERIHRAQNWLHSFDFHEMWPTTSAPPSAARGCFDRLRKWLCQYFQRSFEHWPPTVEGRMERKWLTRDLITRLRDDFYGLYDYLVDREVIFDGLEYRPGQKWAITSKSGQAFRADTSDLPLTAILIGFDERHGFPHIPHPYPVTPDSVPVQSRPKNGFTLKKPASQAELIALSRRKGLSYAEASNVYTLRNQYIHTDLVTNFIKFEQQDMVETLDPYEARRGRWILIYGILQVLATVTVDSPALRYKEGAQYDLSPQMKGIVPWAEVGSPSEPEADHKRSHCWVVPQTWAPTAAKSRPGAHKPIVWGQFGDGRSRPGSDDGVHQKVSTPPKDTNIGRRRAEEWLATSGVSHHVETGSDGSSGRHGSLNSRGSGGEGRSGNSGDGSAEQSAMSARRRRAVIHGFTDFEVPSDW